MYIFLKKLYYLDHKPRIKTPYETQVKKKYINEIII